MEPLASHQVPIVPFTPGPYPIQETGPLRRPLAYVDVYVDDFLKLTQSWYNAMRVRCSTFHNIDRVFRPNDTGNAIRKQPILQSKLGKEDDFWSTQKVMLGWLIDTVACTISLPPHRQERLLLLLSTITNKFLGELRSMSLAIPGSQSCFSFLQHALRPGAKRIVITDEIRDQLLLDFLHLAQDVVNRPTHLAEVVPTPPTYYGSVDAAKAGMGGVWFPPSLPVPNAIHPTAKRRLQGPCLWRFPFPEEVQSHLVSTSNPTGSITNSDLELTGSITHDDVLATTVGVTHLTTYGMNDNSPTVA